MNKTLLLCVNKYITIASNRTVNKISVDIFSKINVSGSIKIAFSMRQVPSLMFHSIPKGIPIDGLNFIPIKTQGKYISNICLHLLHHAG